MSIVIALTANQCLPIDIVSQSVMMIWDCFLQLNTTHKCTQKFINYPYYFPKFI